MRNPVYFLLLLTAVSCSGNPQGKYEKTIADNVQTDKRGTWFDMQFKAIDLQETGKVTVADSIEYLTGEFRKDQQLFIDRIELAKTMTEDLQAKTKSKKEQEKYTADIAKMNSRIDSLKNLAPTNLNGYDSKEPGDILALIIRCKYSIVPPSTNTRAEETFDFYLSPDGSKCYTRKRVK